MIVLLLMVLVPQIIEECNERLTEEQVDFLAEKVESILKKSAVLS